MPFSFSPTRAAVCVALLCGSASAAPLYLFGNVDPATTALSTQQNQILAGCYIGAFEDTGDNSGGAFYGSKMIWAHIVTFSPTLDDQKVGKITIPLTSNGEVRMQLFEINGSVTAPASYTSLGYVVKTPETLHTKDWCSFDFGDQNIVLDSAKTYGIELQTANVGSHYGSKLNYWAGKTQTGGSLSLVRNAFRVMADRQGTPIAPSSFATTMSLLTGFQPSIAIEAVVPEPTSIGALALATLVLRRRR